MRVRELEKQVEEVRATYGKRVRELEGRLAEAVANFESAHRMDPKNQKLKESLSQMGALASRLENVQASVSNAVDDLCGTPCQDLVDSASIAICDVTFADGCGDADPPAGFLAESRVSELCAHACAYLQLARSEAVAPKEEL